MTWLILLVLAIGIVWLIKKKPREEVQQHSVASSHPQQSEQQSIRPNDEDESELIAVITAAIAEFTGTSSEGFRVLSIRQHSANWALTGRQDVMHNRL